MVIKKKIYTCLVGGHYNRVFINVFLKKINICEKTISTKLLTGRVSLPIIEKLLFICYVSTVCLLFGDIKEVM